MARVLVLTLLVIGFCGCKPASREKEAAALMREANALLAQTTELAGEWVTEWGSAFRAENRAKFPANRDSLKTSADKIVKILDEQARLTNRALAKYEEAIPLIDNEQHRRGYSLLVSYEKETLQANELIKSQMQLVSDKSIVDAKTFDEKFVSLAEQFGTSRRESEAQFKEAKRILGM
jgi:hypothetical protein